ncbi:DUF4249 domain-containing protein [Tamlana crocina]|uniref:DUF4249 domain-containing protein n=1 Tax=Tamlana crocina TaxID=393006 RepID=A0ABX1DDH5_9FLAO|nr:DUF4249 domain-containing protein [Tamlana crocina]NJX16405.1 DUF4249 domain-containing protein [Tamlana crocina]
MKAIKHILWCLPFLIWSCEDVIDVELENSAPRLVIDASLNWIKGTSGNAQSIQLSLTAPYFSNEIMPATGALVSVSDNNRTYRFVEDGDTGFYKTERFQPELNGIYKLNIEYNNEIYTATTVLKPVVPIDYVEQKNDGGFSGDEIEIKAFYHDPIETEDYYLFEFVFFKNNKISLEVYDDEFTNGNEIFAFFSDDSLNSGDKITIRNYGITQRTFQYFSLLLQQTDDEAGDPFQTQPATLRGNCVNLSNSNNFPLGYFKASEVDAFTYTIQ